MALMAPSAKEVPDPCTIDELETTSGAFFGNLGPVVI